MGEVAKLCQDERRALVFREARHVREQRTQVVAHRDLPEQLVAGGLRAGLRACEPRARVVPPALRCAVALAGRTQDCDCEDKEEQPRHRDHKDPSDGENLLRRVRGCPVRVLGPVYTAPAASPRRSAPGLNPTKCILQPTRQIKRSALLSNPSLSAERPLRQVALPPGGAFQAWETARREPCGRFTGPSPAAISTSYSDDSISAAPAHTGHLSNLGEPVLNDCSIGDGGRLRI